LSEANLLPKFGHEFIIPVEVLQSRLSLYFSLGINGGRVQQELSFFFLVEKKSQLISGIEKLVGNV
jgi:hypothetical protein